jgi:hypothetical protein
MALAGACAAATFISGCGTAGMTSHYGATQNIDIHFTYHGEEIKGATCVIRNSDVNKSVTAPACAAVPSSYSTLLVRCEAPGVQPGYVDADFASGYPQRLVVQSGIEKRYVYSVTNNVFHEVGVTSNQTELPPAPGQTVARQFARAAGAAQRAADLNRRVCEGGQIQ